MMARSSVSTELVRWWRETFLTAIAREDVDA